MDAESTIFNRFSVKNFNVQLSDVLIIVGPLSGEKRYDVEAVEQVEQQRKEHMLEELELRHKTALLDLCGVPLPESQDSWWGASLISTVLNNIQVKALYHTFPKFLNFSVNPEQCSYPIRRQLNDSRSNIQLWNSNTENDNADDEFTLETRFCGTTERSSHVQKAGIDWIQHILELKGRHDGKH